jgi:hypothetical protein
MDCAGEHRLACPRRAAHQYGLLAARCDLRAIDGSLGERASGDDAVFAPPPDRTRSAVETQRGAFVAYAPLGNVRDRKFGHRRTPPVPD